MRVFAAPEELKQAVGTEIGASGWLTIDQSRIDRFADATGDHQWIHVDPQRAKDGPFGTTIAHGFLTLSLIPVLVAEIYRVDGVRMAVNYGLNRVRFVNPVPVDSAVRAILRLVAVDEVGGGGLQLTGNVTVEIQGAEKPAAVAETLSRLYV
ncbi:MAG: MaoC family dehydratase [Actinocrinis sp.]